MEEEGDPFFWLMECGPTASQEAEFPNCPYARESEVGSPYSIPSSPSTDVSSPIRLISLPGTPTSPDQREAEEGAASGALPERHDGSYYLEEPNPKEVGAQESKGGRAVAGEEPDGEIEVVETEEDECLVEPEIRAMWKKWLAKNAIPKAAKGREIEGSMKSSHGNGGVGSSNGKRIEKIGSRKRKSPPLHKGKDKVAGQSSEGRSGSTPSMKGKEKVTGQSSEGRSRSTSSMKGKEKVAGQSSEGRNGSTSSMKGKEKVAGQSSEGRSGSTSLMKGKDKVAGQSSEGWRRSTSSTKGKEKVAGQSSEGRSESTPSMKGKAKDVGESSKKSCEEPDPELVALIEELLKKKDVDSLEKAKEKGMKFDESRFFSGDEKIDYKIRSKNCL